MILVCGAGGFIGGHLVERLLADGKEVRAVDIKPWAAWWQTYADAQSVSLCDLRDPMAFVGSVRGIDAVYNLACDMGGMGYIAAHRADCMLSVSINTNLLQRAWRWGVDRYFYSSSACVYPAYRQAQPGAEGLKEADAYPADCEDGYGWEKLFSERLCRHFAEDYGLATRVARLHNCYGPMGTWAGGREKAPAAICRKIAQAQRSGHHEIEIWGDGEQTRSFMHVDDCVEGILRIMRSSMSEPINLGSSELVSINQLVDAVEAIAGIKVRRRYVDGPEGVRGRASDNTLIRSTLGWEPSITLAEGLQGTYRWIYDQLD